MNTHVEVEIDTLRRVIGSNVKKQRELSGLSQFKLAEEIGQKSTTIISQGELAKNKHFNIEQLYKISKVLKCDMCDFFKV